MQWIRRIMGRLKCRHERLRLIEYGDVYSDIYGYDYTRFVFECVDCGKRHVSKTRSPEYFKRLLDEAIKTKHDKTVATNHEI